MEPTPLPSYKNFKEVFSSVLQFIEQINDEKTRNESGVLFFDAKGVFDDGWAEIFYDYLEKTFANAYFDDKDIEHKIAHIMVSIVLDHRYIDGNKRSALLMFLILIAIYSDTDKASDFFHRKMEEIALVDEDLKFVASAANSQRKESTERIASLIRSLELF